MTRLPAFIVALLLGVASAQAVQLYRWVDEQGHVEWRDTPPPPTATNVERIDVQGNAVSTAPVPYAVQQAAKNFPVTLWNSNCGEPCDKARALLARRGIPHTERDAKADIEAFRKATGGMEVPVLMVGSRILKGYSEAEWNNALDAAGYLPSAGPAAPAGK